MQHDFFFETNRANWDDRVEGHLQSKEYDVAGLLGDPTRISREVAFARTELGEVRGKRLLHLQCHIGTDTLSWARAGASVVGLDFSPKSVEAAAELARRAGVKASFVMGNVYDAPALLNERFDVVYTGVGALCWLPNVRRWASVVAECLKPGGLLYLHDGHPFLFSLSDDAGPEGPRVVYPYFETPEPLATESSESYAGTARLEHTKNYEWSHGLGETITASIETGFHIHFVHEHRQAGWRVWPHMVQDAQGWWVLPEHSERVPMMYSIKATLVGVG